MTGTKMQAAIEATQETDRPVRFELPPELEAHEPPELRGLRRDQVRLMVLPRTLGRPIHTRFSMLADYLRPGDLLVANNSRTLPGLLRAHDQRGEAVEVRLAHRRSERVWDSLLLRDRTHVGSIGMLLDFDRGLTARIDKQNPDLPFLWQVEFNRCCLDLLDHIYRLGEPVRYSYVRDPLPIDLYQTVYAGEPGSVEMPSAGRALTWQAIRDLARRGVSFEMITLHTGLSSTRDDDIDASHPIYEEEYDVPEATAMAVNHAHLAGGRVVAVGTTVVRALETAASGEGMVHARHETTRLFIDSGHKLRAVDGLMTGFHEPHASHLNMLTAFVDPARLESAYLEAIEQQYLWHEFGDVNLIL